MTLCAEHRQTRRAAQPAHLKGRVRAALSGKGMYQVDGKDRVRELTDIPQSSVGAPIPVVIAGEQSLALAFYEEISDPGWDGSTSRLVDPDTKEKSVVIIRFADCSAHLFGEPNSEILSGHPLYERGLRAHGNFEVKNSSWIRAQEKMNAVHPFHRRLRFLKDKRHFVFAFHDSTFECIAKGYTVERVQGSIREVSTRLGSEIE